MFIDRVILQCKAGRGGDGIVSWQREKFIPKGGPGGGNGGRGGSIVVQSDNNLSSLDNFRNTRIVRAKDGKSGGPKCMQGKNGEDLLLKVPCGTQIIDCETGEILYDFVEPGLSFVLCAGGHGGLGNFFFRSPTNQTPTESTPGTEGEIKEVELELKLIADIGLVGFPNSGKSTLLSALCNVDVPIASYPFTTLHPNLSFISNDGQKRLFIADIPGLIKGAHQNKGLGFAFLRHIERTKILLFVLDAAGTEGRTPVADFRTLRKELELYSPALLEKPLLIALNKCDLEESTEYCEEFTKTFPEFVTKTYPISAYTGAGLESLSQALESLGLNE